MSDKPSFSKELKRVLCAIDATDMSKTIIRGHFFYKNTWYKITVEGATK